MKTTLLDEITVNGRISKKLYCKVVEPYIAQLEQKLAKAEAALKVYEEAVGNVIEAKTKIGTDLTLVYAQQKVKDLLGSEG